MTVAIPAIQETDYVTERGKPMPDWNHAITQTNIAFELKTAYRKRFRIVTEAHTELRVRDRVPDVSIYPPSRFDPDNNPLSVSPPLCAIEILSKMQSPNELKRKGKNISRRERSHIGSFCRVCKPFMYSVRPINFGFLPKPIF